MMRAYIFSEKKNKFLLDMRKFQNGRKDLHFIHTIKEQIFYYYVNVILSYHSRALFFFLSFFFFFFFLILLLLQSVENIVFSKHFTVHCSMRRELYAALQGTLHQTDADQWNR